MIHYVLGFVFNEKADHVLLIKKSRPKWQEGRYNGLGGKVGEDEKVSQAMYREFKEECGIELSPKSPEAFVKFGVIVGRSEDSYTVHCFRAFTDRISEAKTMTDETVVTVPISLMSYYHTVDNLAFLIPLAKDTAFEQFQIMYP